MQIGIFTKVFPRSSLELVLDDDRYLALLQRSGFSGTLLLHGLAGDQVEGCVSFLRGKLAQATG